MATIRLHILASVAGAFLALSGCDQSGAPFGGGADEQAALADPNFTKPFMLHLGQDTYATSLAVASMNGVDNRPTDGALQSASNYRPCHVTTDPELYWYLFASVDSYQFQSPVLSKWLVARQLLEYRTYRIRYTHVNFPEYGTESIVVCPVVSEDAAQYMAPEDRARGVHGGIVVPFMHRKFVEWAYRNRYDADMPGSGKVKMFAGTYTYEIVSDFPGVIPSSQGAATVKLMFNPDIGHWQMFSWQYQDPPVSLQ